MIKMWMTKYALTNGVKEVECREERNSYKYPHPRGYWVSLKLGVDIFKTKNEALLKADDMRLKEIAKLEKTILKLKSMTFNG